MRAVERTQRRRRRAAGRASRRAVLRRRQSLTGVSPSNRLPDWRRRGSVAQSATRRDNAHPDGVTWAIGWDSRARSVVGRRLVASVIPPRPDARSPPPIRTPHPAGASGAGSHSPCARGVRAAGGRRRSSSRCGSAGGCPSPIRSASGWCDGSASRLLSTVALVVRAARRPARAAAVGAALAHARVPRRGAVAVPASHCAACRPGPRAVVARCGFARQRDSAGGGGAPARARRRAVASRPPDARPLRAGACVLAHDRRGDGAQPLPSSTACAGPACCTTSASCRCHPRSSTSPDASPTRSSRSSASTPPTARSSPKGLRDWLGEDVDAVDQHHERWAGGGYPYGLRGLVDHAVGSHRVGRRCLRCHDLGALVQEADPGGGCPIRARTLRRVAVRSRRRAGDAQHLARLALACDGTTVVGGATAALPAAGRAGEHARDDIGRGRGVDGDHRSRCGGGRRRPAGRDGGIARGGGGRRRAGGRVNIAVGHRAAGGARRSATASSLVPSTAADATTVDSTSTTSSTTTTTVVGSGALPPTEGAVIIVRPSTTIQTSEPGPVAAPAPVPAPVSPITTIGSTTTTLGPTTTAAPTTTSAASTHDDHGAAADVGDVRDRVVGSW